ncbi:MAG: hypothetical protein ABJB97_01340 [Acidobacteriota bacterium]
MPDPQPIIIPRAVLLIEIDRRCFFPGCGARISVALTREEAAAYAGFECAACGRWNEDKLVEKEVPDSWTALKADQGLLN